MKKRFDNETRSSEGTQAVILSFLGGLLDVYCKDCFGIYATMHTGNIINLGIDIAEGRFHKIPEPLLIILAFAIGIYAANAYESRRGRRAIGGMLKINTILLCAAVFIPVDENPGLFAWQDLASAVIFGIVGAFMIHTFVRFNSWTYSSTMMTANINRMMTSLYSRIARGEKESGHAVLLYAMIILMFTLGVVLGHAYLSHIPAKTESLGILKTRNLILILPILGMTTLYVTLKNTRGTNE